MKTNTIRRRRFVQALAATAATVSLATRSSAWGASANGRLRTAHIGVGGMGGADLGSISSHKKVEVAALCDVDQGALERASAAHPNAKTFRDFREMFAAMGKSIDAVVVSTPDHTHAPAAMTAMNHDKPVYCQKPLTHEVHEARQLRLVSEKKKLVTQMGIQVHSSAVYRRAARMIQDGAIGKVSQVHAWSSKNWGFDGAKLPDAASVPETLDWNLWLGTADKRDFVPGVYHPGAWRKLIDFGTGTLGDMGVHIFDTPYSALELTFPNWVKTTCRASTGVGHPEKNLVEYEFPETKHTTKTMRWTWYDGGAAPPKPGDLKLGAFKLPDAPLPDQGALFVGEEGLMLLPHVAEAVLYPEEKFKDFKRPDVPEGNHYHQWVDACLGEGKTLAPFAYGGLLTEALLLGVVANRFPGQRLDWNAEELTVANVAEANKLLKRQYREGFAVEGL